MNLVSQGEVKLKNELIQVLSEIQLEAILAKPSEGLIADTHICNINWNDGKTTRAYVKRFKSNEQLGLLNEITGYILARHSQLPVPLRAGLIKINPLAFKDSSLFGEWAFVISEVSGVTPGSYYSNGALTECKSLMDLVASWSKVCDTIAFDDWIANEDRNLGNLVVAGRDNIFLIDHSNIPFVLNWTAQMLDPQRESKNALASNLWALQSTPLPVKAKISSASKNHETSYSLAINDLKYWWGILLKSDQQRVHALNDFLEKRAKNSQTRISNNFGLLAV